MDVHCCYFLIALSIPVYSITSGSTIPHVNTRASQINIDGESSARKFAVPKYNKRHDIINVLWRKTKIFDYADEMVSTEPYKYLIPNTTIYQIHKHVKKSLFTQNYNYLKKSLSTPISNIEFYYFDSPSYNKAKISATSNQNNPTKTSHFIKTDGPDPKYNFLNNKSSIIRRRNPENERCHRSINTKTNLKGETSNKIIGNSAKPWIRSSKTTTNSSFKTKIIPVKNSVSKINPSPQDTINFFEKHDSQTENPLILTKYTEHTRLKSTSKKNYKRHEVPKRRKPKDVNTDLEKRITTSPSMNEKDESENVTFLKTDIGNFTKSKAVAWDEFPFLASYIHENSKVHCDAGGISNHWLITAGSCLYRYHEDPELDARSAFVTYCGLSWKNPKRIAYVKYSVIHPYYLPQDETRRHLYNIGLIQVSSSMLSCAGWMPLPLTTHLFITDKLGSPATALGWGLNRYCSQQNFNYAEAKLMQYDGVIFSNECPGNADFSKLKLLPELGGSENIYCLMLPPYKGESQDPVHGGLLFAAGKLIALYLEEERRSAGVQTAQYTGVWRLLAWIHDVAREPDVPDALSIDI